MPKELNFNLHPSRLNHLVYVYAANIMKNNVNTHEKHTNKKILSFSGKNKLNCRIFYLFLLLNRSAFLTVWQFKSFNWVD